MDDKLRFSRFTHLIPVENWVAVYNAANLAVIFITPDIAKLFEQFQNPYTPDEFLSRVTENKRAEWEKTILQMKQWHMLVPHNHNDLSVLKSVQKSLEKLPVAILYLLLTDICNFACRYCFIENEIPPHHKFSIMTEEIAKKGINLFAKTLENENSDHTIEPTIIFYGGEPLLNWKVMKSALKYIAMLKSNSTLSNKTKVTLNTNASLITSEIAHELAEHGVTVAVSLDGNKLLHDKARPFQNGRGTFDEVMNGIHNLQENGVSWGVSCTISEFNLPFIEDVLKWLVENFSLTSLGFNIGRDTNTYKISDSVKFAEDVSQALIRCYEIARENGIYEDRIMRKVRSFIDGKPRFNDCAGCGQQIVVGPTGELGTCHGFWGSKKFFVHPTSNFNAHTHPIWVEWRRRSPFSMEQCYDCVALGICGGGCPEQAFFQHGTIWDTDDAFCIHSKLTLQYLLCELVKQKEK